MSFKTLTLLPAAVALAAFAAPAAQAIVLTTLPGVVASANACYLNPGCAPTGLWAAAYVIDGVPYDTAGYHSWNAGEYGSLAAPQWVRLDFGSSYQLDAVTLGFTNYGAQYAGYSNVYEFRTSLDGVNWLTSASGTLFDSADPALRNNTWTWAADSGPLARYVEYRVVGGTHWATLGEMTVSGVAATVPEPASTAMLLAGLAAVGLMARRRFSRD